LTYNEEIITAIAVLIKCGFRKKNCLKGFALLPNDSSMLPEFKERNAERIRQENFAAVSMKNQIRRLLTSGVNKKC
jgi:hypothetical protein